MKLKIIIPTLCHFTQKNIPSWASASQIANQLGAYMAYTRGVDIWTLFIQCKYMVSSSLAPRLSQSYYMILTDYYTHTLIWYGSLVICTSTSSKGRSAICTTPHISGLFWGSKGGWLRPPETNCRSRYLAELDSDYCRLDPKCTLVLSWFSPETQFSNIWSTAGQNGGQIGSFR
jgi:hypothetical protein